MRFRVMTRLWVLSDLHLEAVPFPDGYDPIRPEFDVLAAAGDLWQVAVWLCSQPVTMKPGG